MEDLEGKEGISNDLGDEKGHETEAKEGSQVFLKLVETMKASGNLPEKPTPTVSKDSIRPVYSADFAAIYEVLVFI